MCVALRDKSIWLVGDSIQYQMFESLSKMTGGSEQLPSPRTTEEKSEVRMIQTCNGTAVIGFVRNDHVRDSGESDACNVCEHGCNYINCPFWRYVRDADVVIFNRGSHWVPDGRLRREMLEFRLRTHARTRARTHARMHTRTHARTHEQVDASAAVAEHGCVLEDHRARP